MNSTRVHFSRNNKSYRNKTAAKYELPFIKVTLTGRKNETTQILRKVKNSKRLINKQIDKLLFTGFNGSLEDFYKVYGRKGSLKIKKPKIKAKLGSALLFQSDVLQGPLKLTKTKEFNFMSKNKEKAFNMRTLLNEYNNKKNKFKFNFNLEKNKNNNIKNKSALNINIKNISKCNIDIPKDNFSNYTNLYNKEYIINKQKENLQKLLKINKIRRILRLKSRNIFKENNKSLQKSAFQENSIKESEIKNDLIKIEENKSKESKNQKFDNSQNINSIYNRKYIDNNKSKSSKNIKRIFRKYIEKKNEKDSSKLKNILDSLRTGFKSDLKEVQKFEGKDKINIWMKRSTANIISYGNSFQIMADVDFYKDHKRIIGVYPNIEREANILVFENKSRDERIIDKLKCNERKIRYIVNDTDELLKKIKSKTIRPSKSQISFYKRKKI